MKLHVTLRAITFALATVLLPSAGAHAEIAAPADSVEAAVGKMIELNKKAIGAYKTGDSAAAVADLEAALKVANDNGLSHHDMTARTQIHLGIVSIVALKDRNRGLVHFAHALAIRPRIKLTQGLGNRALRRDLRIARRVKLPPPPPVAAPPPAVAKAKEPTAPVAKFVDDGTAPPLPRAVPQPLYCPTPDLGPPGQPVPLFCLTQPEVEIGKVVAYFRPGGAELYTAVPMNRARTGWLSATIPGPAVRGRSLQVYFEAKDGTGNVAAHNGKDEMPNVILLKEGAPQVVPRKLALIEVGAPPPADEDRPDEATPLELREREEESAARSGLTPKGRPRREKGKLFVGFGAGSGYGWHLELPLERRPDRQVSRGFSPAGLGHVAPEIGYQLTSRLALSIQGRHQYLPASGSGDAEVTGAPPQLAHAALLRLHYAMFDIGDLQFVGTLAAGGGTALRMQIAPNRRLHLASSDTVVAGPFAAGPGLALAYNFTSHVIATLEGRALTGMPALGILMEGTAALQYAF